MRLSLFCCLLLALAVPARAEDVCARLAQDAAEGRLAAARAGDLAAPHDSPDRDAVIAVTGEADYARYFFDQHAVERLRLDIDGDGERDHVFLQIVGAQHCPHLTVYRGGRTPGWLAAAGSTSWCGWSPFFVQANGAAHLVADDPAGILDVARFVPGRGFQRLCTVEIAWTGAPEMDSSLCQDELCRAASFAAGSALREPMRMTGGRPGSLDFVRDGQLYRTDGGFHVDLDNDGFEEYVKPGRGGQSQFYLEVYAKEGGAYRDVDPAIRWPGFEQISGGSRPWLPFFDDEKLDIVRVSGRTLLLGITKDRSDGAFRDRRAYRVAVFTIDGGATRFLGELLASDRPSVKLRPCRGECGVPTE